MELWLVRHAAAEDAAPGHADARRALTARGRRRFTRAARGLRALGAGCDALVHSPWLRAQETAEILSAEFGGDHELRVSAALARPPDERLLAELSGERVVLVGHEPWLTDLLLWLTLGWRVLEPSGCSARVELRKGGVAHLAGDPRPGEMRLVALYTPRVLRRCAR